MLMLILKERRFLLAVGLALLLLLGGFLYHARLASGATYTWDGEGATSNWSDCDNWTSNTCPTSADIAAFDATSVKDAVVDASFAGSVKGIDINTGYTGSIMQERNITIGSSNYVQDDGTWQQGTTTFDINLGSFTLSGGTFQAGEGTSTVQFNFTLTGGTFNASTTRVISFDTSGSNFNTTLSCAGYGGVMPVSINVAKNNNSDFTLASGCAATTTGALSSGNIISSGNLYISGGDVALGSLTINASGVVTVDGNVDLAANFTNNGTFVMTGTAMNVQLSFIQNGTFDLTGITLTFDGNGSNFDTTLSCSGYGGVMPIPITISKTNNSDFTLASGCAATTTGALSSGNIISSGNLYISGGDVALGSLTINASGVVRVDGDVDLAGNFFNNGTFVMTGTAMNVQLSFIQNGTFDLTGITLTFDGNGSNFDTTLSCSGNLGGVVKVAKTQTSSFFILDSGCAVVGTTTTNGGPITINGTWSTEGTTFTSSSLTVGSSGRLRLYGDETVTTPTLSSGAVVEYYGPGTYSGLAGISDFQDIEFTGGGTNNVSGDITVAGDFASTDGSSFNQTSGTVTLDGGNQTVTGTSTFANLTKTITSTSTLFFGANQEQTITGALTLQGDNDSTLLVQSTATDTQAKLDMQGLRTLEYDTISDINNTNAATAYCSTGCVDGGNNTNITFGADPDGSKIYWDGGGATNNWSECANWKLNTCPDATFAAAFDSRSTKDATIDASFSGNVSGFSIENGYTGTITAARDLIVGTDGFSQTAGTFAPGNYDIVMDGVSTLAASSGTTFNDLFIGGAYATSLIAYWKLDEANGGTVAAEAINGYSATPFGTGGTNNKPQPSAAVPSAIDFTDSYSLTFDGTDDYLEISNESAFDFTSGVTVSAWLMIDDAGTDISPNQYIFSKAETTGDLETYALLVANGGSINSDSLSFRISNGTWSEATEPITNFSPGTWYHITGTFDGSFIRLYVNGIEVASTAKSGSIRTNDIEPRIGSNGDGSRFFDGSIDDLRVYDHALSSTQIARLASGARGVGSATATLSGSTLDVNGNITILTGSTLDASTAGCSGSSCNIEVGGDWANSGTFTARSGTVTLDGANQNILGDTTFHNLSKTVSAADTLTFEASSTQTITGTLILTGVSNGLLTLESSASGTPWSINPQSTRNIEYVTVQDSTNANSTAIEVEYTSTDNGNNTNWTFLAPPPEPIKRIIRGAVRFFGGVRF